MRYVTAQQVDLCPSHLELCQASVVFGLGKSQYVTEVIESNEPEWNQEAIMYVQTVM